MKEKIRKTISKQIICIITVIMLCNFVVPNYSYAVSTEGGGSLVKIFAEFACTIADVVVEFLQNKFVSEDSIIVKDVEYRILYSPGIIFSGTVPALDINFIKPNNSKYEKINYKIFGVGYNLDTAIDEATEGILKECGFLQDDKISSDVEYTIEDIYEHVCNLRKEVVNTSPGLIEEKTQITPKYIQYTINNEEYELYMDVVSDGEKAQFYYASERNDFPDERTLNIEFNLTKEQCQDSSFEKSTKQNFKTELQTHFSFDNNGEGKSEYEKQKEELKNLLKAKEEECLEKIEKDGTYKINVEYETKNGGKFEFVLDYDAYRDEAYHYKIWKENYNSKAEKEYKSTAQILQNAVVTWYNVFRRIALVGLLLALVYIGIRIVLKSTSAKEKAKYKKMLKDWLVALCLLFVLHYIMNLTIIVVNKINEIIQVSAIGIYGEDILMSTIRTEVAKGKIWGDVIVYAIMYCTLVVYTVIYTVQYLKRVIYLAFLTMIAPLITLTYPLDKIKDNKSQAFDMWLKDYIFFTLLQVLHLLIYYIFLGSSLNMANSGNWIFALVTLGFMTKAEKIMKKMFGFEKSKTMGALTAGATGAFIMNQIDKIAHKPPKGGKSGGTSSGHSGKESTKVNVRTATVNPLMGLNLGVSNSSSGGGTTYASGQSTSGNTASSGSTSSRSTGRSTQTSSTNSIWDKPVIKGSKYVVGKFIKNNYKKVAIGAVGVGTGIAGGVIGIATGISQGDIKAAITGATVGFAGGKNVGQGVAGFVEKTPKEVKKLKNDIMDTYREGAYGEEYANNIKFDREFRDSQEYKSLKNQFGQQDKNFDKKISQMLEAGITDSKKMKKILKNNNTHPRKYNMEKAMAYSKMAEKCSNEVLYSKGKFIRFCQDNNVEISQENMENIRKCIIDFK